MPERVHKRLDTGDEAVVIPSKGNLAANQGSSQVSGKSKKRKREASKAGLVSGHVEHTRISSEDTTRFPPTTLLNKPDTVNKPDTILQHGHDHPKASQNPPKSQDQSLKRRQTKTSMPQNLSSTNKDSIKERAKALWPTRKSLPIWSHSLEIRRGLRENDVLLLVGETGSGKSTQVPQILLQEPWCRTQIRPLSTKAGTQNVRVGGCIAVTEPRRVAAISLARRVADEMGSPLGSSSPASQVGYSVRFDNSTSPSTKIKFLTEGMLLQEILRDPFLKGYSAVVVDEVHERGANVDLVLGFLRRMLVQGVEGRGGVKLKVCVMSATAEMERLRTFFGDENEVGGKEKVLDGDEITLNGGSDTNHSGSKGRMAPGSGDALNGDGVVKSGARAGGVVTGNVDNEESEWSGISTSEDQDAEEAPRKQDIEKPGLSNASNGTPEESQPDRSNGIIAQAKNTNEPRNPSSRPANNQVSPQVTTCHIEGRQFSVKTSYVPEPVQDIVEASLKTVFQIHYKEPMPGDILVFLTGQETVESLETLIKEYSEGMGPEVPRLLVLPLFAALPQAAQQRVFEPAPLKTRKVIISTNIAETSVTVSGVRFVIDCGKAKIKHFRSRIGLESLLVKPISKSAAIQRKGRAGREAPGECYRLYTEKDYLALQDSNTPEILRCDLSHPILTMKARGIDNVITFPFLDPPPQEAIEKALIHLWMQGALTDSGSISEIGLQIARFPLSVSLGRALIAAAESEANCVAEVIDIIACLSVENLFLNLTSEEKKEQAETARRGLYRREGDHLTLLATVRAYAAEGSDRKAWADGHFVSHRAMRAVMDVRKQLRAQSMQMGTLSKDFPDTGVETAVSSDRNVAILKSFLKGFAMNTAMLCPDGSYKTFVGKQTVAIHPGSVLFGRKVEAIMFNEFVFTKKSYARGVSAVQLDWIGERFPTE